MKIPPPPPTTNLRTRGLVEQRRKARANATPPPPTGPYFQEPSRFAILKWDTLKDKAGLYWTGNDWGSLTDALIFNDILECFEYTVDNVDDDNLIVQGSRERPMLLG